MPAHLPPFTETHTRKKHMPKRKYTVRKGGWITKSQLNKRGMLVSDPFFQTDTLGKFRVERCLQCPHCNRTGTLQAPEQTQCPSCERDIIPRFDDILKGHNRGVILYKLADIEALETAYLHENIDRKEVRHQYAEIYGIPLPEPPDDTFTRDALLQRGHWIPEYIDQFLTPETHVYAFVGIQIRSLIYRKKEVRKVERSTAFKNAWQAEKRKKKARRDADRDAEKITVSRLISERGWTRGDIEKLLGPLMCF